MRTFWEGLDRYREREAIVDVRAGVSLSYQQLTEAIHTGAERLRSYPRTLVRLDLQRDAAGLCCYLSALAAGHVVWLRTPSPAAGTTALECHPGQIVLRRAAQAGPLHGYEIQSPAQEPPQLHPSLALLLATSGSMGAPKLARLSYTNLCAGAEQSAAALRIGAGERVLAGLPLHHIYTLSIAQAALSVGATVLLGSGTVLDRAFWDAARACAATFLPMVPTQLELMRRSGVGSGIPGSLRKISISGSALQSATRAWLMRRLIPAGIDIYSTYGMTETAGRIAALAAEEFLVRPRSVGRAVCGGNIELLPTGEVVYSGPNVMLGYARELADLQLGDTLGGRLETGDVGVMDPQGNLELTGRLSRVCKLLDTRIDLDEMEAQLSGLGDIAVVTDDRVIAILYAEPAQGPAVRDCVSRIASRLRIPPNLFRCERIAKIPVNANGKRSYALLRRALD